MISNIVDSLKVKKFIKNIKNNSLIIFINKFSSHFYLDKTGTGYDISELNTITKVLTPDPSTFTLEPNYFILTDNNGYYLYSYIHSHQSNIARSYERGDFNSKESSIICTFRNMFISAEGKERNRTLPHDGRYTKNISMKDIKALYLVAHCTEKDGRTSMVKVNKRLSLHDIYKNIKKIKIKKMIEIEEGA